jgi:hypothetical protein
MKKIFAIILATMLVLSITACGNMSLGPGNYSYKKIHVDTHNNNRCFTVTKWYESAAGIEVDTEEAGPMYFSEGQYMMISDECPFCAANNDDANKAPNDENDSVPIGELVDDIDNRLEEIENRVDMIEQGAVG